MEITFYDATGKITGTAFFKDDLADMIKSPDGATAPHIDGNHFAQSATKYVVDGALVDRPVNPATLSGLTLSNLPAPCKIRINATTYDCTETTSTLSFSQPGAYKVTVTAWPHQDKEFSIAYPA